MPYVLIVMAALAGTPIGTNTVVTFETFTSQANCNAAKIFIDRRIGATAPSTLITQCLPK